LPYRWLCWDETSLFWVVYEHPYGKRAKEVTHTYELSKALDVLRGIK
jgi:hypothetical protein